jgi:hypothetical protein
MGRPLLLKQAISCTTQGATAVFHAFNRLLHFANNDHNNSSGANNSPSIAHFIYMEVVKLTGGNYNRITASLKHSEDMILRIKLQTYVLH